MTIGSPIAGESYSLECSVGGLMATFEWMGLPDGRTPILNSSSVTVSSDSFTSRLQFNPLQQSHSGSHTCRTTTSEGTMLSEPVEIQVEGTLIGTCIF